MASSLPKITFSTRYSLVDVKHLRWVVMGKNKLKYIIATHVVKTTGIEHSDHRWSISTKSLKIGNDRFAEDLSSSIKMAEFEWCETNGCKLLRCTFWRWMVPHRLVESSSLQKKWLTIWYSFYAESDVSLQCSGDSTIPSKTTTCTAKSGKWHRKTANQIGNGAGILKRVSDLTGYFKGFKT